MPGIRIMNDSGADARDAESRKRSHDGKLINGDRAASKDAPAVNGASTNGAVSGPLGSNHMADLPPEIAHISSEFYHPLPKLLERISQECYSDLCGVLQAMKDIPVHPQTNGALPNGLGAHQGGALNPEASREKKRLLMKFAFDNRAKFIKLLVLTDWGKKSAADISKVIDISAWTRAQNFSLEMTPIQLQSIKMLTAHARQTNPDIRTALEVLSKGKADWIPDMGFIPPEPVTAEKALKLLRYMDTSLAIRLNVHETLPRHLKKFKIGSGRVTFIVDSEFEMDLMSFSEDASEPWLFIDFRLLFSPAPTIPVGARFQAYFKLQLDTILRDSGLNGCFDFLHNFVLTHKINVLRSQAHQLTRSGWAGSIKVEPVHRSLILQYWTDRPGKKSWIEVGIASNKPKDGKVSWRGPPIPSISVRWFRQGVQVTDADLKFDFANLSMERILKQVVSMHISYYLQTTRKALSSQVSAKISLSPTEPCDCNLEVSLGRTDNSATLSLEPVTGRFVLRPCTSISAQVEQSINHAQDPLATTSANIVKLLAKTLQDRIQRQALQIGWQPQSGQAFRLDAVKAATGIDAIQFSMFWPGGWTSAYALVSIIDSNGETWWNFKLDVKGSKIESAEQICMERPGPKPALDRSTLCSIERVALQQLSFSSNRCELEKRRMRYGVSSASTRSSSLDASPARGWMLQLPVTDLLKAKADNNWLDPCICLTYQGIQSNYKNISHIASGTMTKDVASDMQRMMSASPRSRFVFSQEGNFSILLSTPFGEPIVEELMARLQDVDRLRIFTTTLHKRRMYLKSSSLQQVEFQYSNNLFASVNFGNADDIQVHFDASNPHNLIKSFLRDIINEKSPFFLPINTETNGLDRFCTALVVTRPAVEALAALQSSANGSVRNPGIHTHHLYHFRVTYANPMCSFDIKLQSKDDRVVWLIEDNDRKGNDMKPYNERAAGRKRLESLKTALATFFRQLRPGWYGIRTGIIAMPSALGDTLKALHETVLACAVKDGDLPYIQAEVPPQAIPSAGHSNANANAQANPTAAPNRIPAPSANSNANTRPNMANTQGGQQQQQQQQPRRNAPQQVQRAPPAPTAPMAPTTAKPRLNFPNIGRSANGGDTKNEAIVLD